MKSKTIRFYDYINARFPEFQYTDGLPQNYLKMYIKRPATNMMPVRERPPPEPKYNGPVHSEMTPRRCSTPMSHATRTPIKVQPLPKNFKLKPMTIPTLSMPAAPRAAPKETVHDEEEEEREENQEEGIFSETGVSDRLAVSSESLQVDISSDDDSFEDDIDQNDAKECCESKQMIKIDTTGFPEIPPLAVNLTKLVETMPEDDQSSVSPYTFQENIDKLDDEQYEQFIEEDTVIIKSCKATEGGFSPVEFGNFISYLDKEKYQITMKVALDQFMKVANVYNHNLEYLKCSSFREFADKFETHICEIFRCRTALLWRLSKIGHVLINYSHLFKYPDDVGFLGTCVQEKRPIIAPSPMMHPLYDERYDLPLCEDAEMIAAIPIIEDDEAIGCVLMIDKIHESGAEFLYWPHSDIFLLKLYNTLIPRIFKKFTYESEIIGNDMKFVFKCVSRKFNVQHLISDVISTVCSELHCDSCTLLIKYKKEAKIDKFGLFDFSGNQLRFRHIANCKYGISEDAMTNRKVINLIEGKRHPMYNRNIDERSSDSSVMVVPIIHEDIVYGTCICRAKKNRPFFDKFDISHCEKMMKEFSSIFAEALSIQNNQKRLNNAVIGQNNLASLLQTAESLSSETNIDLLIERIINKSTNLVNADRGSLFIIDDTKTSLISKVALGVGQIAIPVNLGLVGAAFTTNKPINIPDVYQDSRFNSNIDKKTGYKTKSLLTVPITDQKNEVIAVTQLMNKKNGKPFTDNDIELTKGMNVFTGIALNNSKSISDAAITSTKIKALLDTAQALANDSTSLVLHKIIQTLISVIGCERVVFRSRGDKGATRYVMETSKPLKIENVERDSRYDKTKDGNFEVKSIIAVPVRSMTKGVIHVLELQNKVISLNGGKFTDEDVTIASSYASYIGISIDNNESNSDYISLPSLFLEEKIAKETKLPSMIKMEIGNLTDDILGMSETDSIKLIINIFSALNLMEVYEITINSIISVLLRLKAYVSLQRVASGLNLLYFILQTDLNGIFDSSQILAMVLSVLVVKFEFDKGGEFSSHEDINQRDIALSVIFSEPSYRMKLCEFAAVLLEDLMEIDYSTWELITTCLIGTDPLDHFSLIDNLWTLVRPINQMKRNVPVVMQCVVKLCCFSDLTGPFIRSEEWAKARNLQARDMVCFMEFFVFPVINAISEAIPETNVISSRLEGNLSQFVSKCVFNK